MIEWIVSSSALAAVLILLRLILRGKIRLRLQYALWGLLLLRLLIPVSFGSSAISVSNALPREARSIPETVVTGGHMTIQTDQGAHDYVLPRQLEEYRADRESLTQSGELRSVDGVEHVLTLKSILRILWIAGMGIAALCLLGSNLLFARKLRRSRRILTDEEALPIYLTDAADTPCLFGFFRPAIYVTPEAASDEERLRHVIRHELTHFRHGDQWWSLLRAVCLVLHWYNPLVWCAAFLSRRDAELACDEAAIRSLGEGERAAYGRTLIDMTCTRRPALLLTATSMTGGRGGIRERIRLIASKPKTIAAALIALLLIAAIAVGCTFTGAKTPETTPTSAPTPSSETSDPKPSAAVSDPNTERLEEERNLIELALPYAEQYAGASSLALRTEGTKVYQYGESVEVRFPSVGSRFSVSVTLMKGEDGAWSVQPNGVKLITNDWKHAPLSLSLGGKKVPREVSDYAVDTALLELEYLEQDCGYVFSKAEVTGITQIETGTAALDYSINLYRLEWRFRPEEGEEIMLVGGMTMENGWLTEWGSTGQPYLLMLCEENGDTRIWTRICVTNTDRIETEYGTPEMLEQYGNAYTAAAMELYHRFLGIPSRGYDSEHFSPIGFSVNTTSEAPAEIGRAWAETYAAQFVNAPEGHPEKCEASAVLGCELVAESLLQPKAYIFNMRFACKPLDENAVLFITQHNILTAEEDPQHAGWESFQWFAVLRKDPLGDWKCAAANTDYGGWEWLDFTRNAAYWLDQLSSGKIDDEIYLMHLPFVDWREFDRRSDWDWNALYQRLEAAALTEGRVYGPEETRMWRDVYPDDQAYRDMYMLLGYLNSDGAYAEGLAALLQKQFDYDPETFAYCLKYCLSEEQRLQVLTVIDARDAIDMTATLRYYKNPTLEKKEPEIGNTVLLNAKDPADAEKIDGVKAILDKKSWMWTNDQMVDRVEFYFDGDITLSDREFVYYFSFGQKELYYDHYFTELLPKEVEYLQSLSG